MAAIRNRRRQYDTLITGKVVRRRPGFGLANRLNFT